MRKAVHKKIKVLIMLNIFLIAFNYLLVLGAKKYPNIIEKYYSRKAFHFINRPLSYISNKFDFSLGEVLVFIVGALILILFFKSFYNLILRKYSSFILNLLIIFLIFLSTLSYYQVIWGLNNYRVPVEKNFDLPDEHISIEDLASSYTYLVLESNKLKNDLLKDKTEVSKEYIFNNIHKCFENLNNEYAFISNNKAIVKPLKISPIFSSSGYSGIYLPFLSESNVNYMVPKSSLPFIASHEMAHQKGFASEDSANFIGFLACYHNDDIFFKYSGFYSMMSYVGNSLYKNDKELYREISSLRSDEILKDIELSRTFWDKHENKRSKKIHNKINDSFLKASNQPQGIVTYSKVTELFVKAHKSGMIN